MIVTQRLYVCVHCGFTKELPYGVDNLKHCPDCLKDEPKNNKGKWEWIENGENDRDKHD